MTIDGCCWLLGPAGHQAGQLSPKRPQPGVLSHEISAKMAQPRLVSHDSTARRPQPRFPSHGFSARRPQPRDFRQNPSAKIRQPGFLSQRFLSQEFSWNARVDWDSKLFGVSRWSHLPKQSVYEGVWVNARGRIDDVMRPKFLGL